jgi:hypothetical protein
MIRAIAALLTAGTLAVSAVALQPNRPGAPGVHHIDQQGDSAFYRVEWDQPAVGAQHVIDYSLSITWRVPRFDVITRTSGGSIPQIDRVGVPLDTLPLNTDWCVTALLTNGQMRGPSCTAVTLPATIVVGMPGAPRVEAIVSGGTVDQADSISIFPRPDTIVNTATLYAIVWWGATPTACVLKESGARGWQQVTLHPDGYPVPFDAGLWTPDPACNVQWSSLDPHAAVTTGEPEPVRVPGGSPG